jgi:hypothetical protein
MHRRKLPIGIQTFREIREDDYYYVDKTVLAHRLIEGGKYYFLSRPRRFGKSLLLDTLGELFSGSEPLFRGLHIHDRWDWNTVYPVIRISFGGGVLQERAALDRRIHAILLENAERLGVACRDSDDIPTCFGELIRHAHARTGQRVVVLVDEYDKPILDNITRPEVARDMRDGLRNLYSVIKGQDAHIRFAFLTGVSKFSKVSLFSGLNNLRDITVSPAYSALCGYTEADVDTVFAPELAGFDRQQIRDWYNGYNWTGEAVYNPFDLLLLFEERQFRPYLVRDRHADVPGRCADAAGLLHPQSGGGPCLREFAVHLRCRADAVRGPVVANRLSDLRRSAADRGPHRVHAARAES